MIFPQMFNSGILSQHEKHGNQEYSILSWGKFFYYIILYSFERPRKKIKLRRIISNSKHKLEMQVAVTLNIFCIERNKNTCWISSKSLSSGNLKLNKLYKAFMNDPLVFLCPGILHNVCSSAMDDCTQLLKFPY